MRTRSTAVTARCALALGLALGGWMPGIDVPAHAAGPAGDAERGRLLYETGADATGQPMQAVRPGAGPLPPGAAACVNCHRPSTRGGIEGGLLVPPIAGDVLFAPGRPPSQQMNMQWMRHQTRSAYDSPLLARALTQGIDPDGKPLGPEMPRYVLGAGALADLDAYLRQRGREPVPGLVNGRLQLATVFTPDAPRARRDTVMKVMQAWATDQRFGQVPVDWQAWSLQGAPGSWRAQLEALNRRTPVFGLVSGAGGAQWQPVQDFCEQQRIACTMPSLDRIPVWTTPPRYSTYLSSAVDGEARMLAALLAGPDGTGSRTVHQVWRGEAAAGAMQVLARALPSDWRLSNPLPWPDDRARPPAAPADGLLLLWLPADAASAWLRAHRPQPKQRVYLSAQLAPALQVQVPAEWRPHLRWLSMRAAPAAFYGALATTLEPWAQAVAARGGVSPVEFADARAAAFLFADAAGLSQGVLRPDFLIERLETAVQQRSAASVYVQASLGPGQRVASKGGHVLGYPGPRAAVPVPISGYLRAEP